ncbi:MAG TPA: low affinity iron permease family protein [Thermoanaerobaculia bacterium]|nr:low affinity iron permease family protein [Thermoanaerobaculia bacterium]
MTNGIASPRRRAGPAPNAPHLPGGSDAEPAAGKNGGGLQSFFRRFAHRSSALFGSPWVFFAALSIIVGWALTGPVFHFSDTWQLVINTGTTVITFLMVFLIQNTQNRDAKAIHLKLDELIRALEPARNRLLELENMSDDELARLEEEFKRLRDRAGRSRREPPRAQAAVAPAPK